MFIKSKTNLAKVGILLFFAQLPPLAFAGETPLETWNAKFQSTFIWQTHPSFNSSYIGANSMLPTGESGHTWSGTAFLGWRPWQDGELYFNPEAVQGKSLSGLHGLGGLTNGENQKNGGSGVTIYRARLFLRQVVGLGGGKEQVDSAANSLGGETDKNRLVLTLGNIAVTDVFDTNSFSHDPRTQFQNWALMANGAFDYAADSRGYTWGGAAEYYRGSWVLRAGRFEQPIESNGLALDSQILRHYGDQFEVEKDYSLSGHAGKICLLLFHNKAKMGNFLDALGAANGGAPDVAMVRREQSKYGYGINLEQSFAGNVGLFARASLNDGATETYAFTEIEHSVSGGMVAGGSAWNRAQDTVGIGVARNALSAAHQAYLAAGGLGAFIGDGRVNYRPESIIETYYSLNLAKQAWLTFDCQHIANPAYNADRGPIEFYGMRLHLEH